MWAGKITIILYLFSVSCLFMFYFVNQVFQNPTITAQGHYTYNAMNTLANTFSISQQINADLVFGDFIAALTVLFGIVTGSTISDAFSGLPFFDASVQLLTKIVFSLSSVFLWIYIIANRSI